MGILSPAAIIYDASGNPVSIISDGGIYRISGINKVLDASGSQINPATKETLDSIKDTDGIKKITDALPAGSNLLGKIQIRNPGNTVDLGDATNPVRTDTTGTTTQPISASSLPLPTGAATEATLATRSTSAAQTDGSQKAQVVDSTGDGLEIDASGRAAIQDQPNMDVALSTRATESTLTSIKDTDGVKKITDALPVGDNVVGRVKITDGTNVSDVVVDNTINRLEVRTTVVGQTAGAGSEKKASVIDDIEDSNVKRLQTQALLAPGSTVNIGTSIPSDPANLTIEFLKNGTSENLRVDGSVTPVEFKYQPSAGKIVSLESVLIVFTADDFEFNGQSFGPNSALTNGIEFELTIDSSNTTIFTIKQNEDFLRIPGRVPIINNTGPKDLLSAVFSFGGLVKLDGDTNDKVSAIINDDLTSVKLKYLTVTVYGAEV